MNNESKVSLKKIPRIQLALHIKFRLKNPEAREERRGEEELSFAKINIALCKISTF